MGVEQLFDITFHEPNNKLEESVYIYIYELSYRENMLLWWVMNYCIYHKKGVWLWELQKYIRTLALFFHCHTLYIYGVFKYAKSISIINFTNA